MHRQGAHGVDSHNVVIVPDQVIGELRERTKTILIAQPNSSFVFPVTFFPLLCRLDVANIAFPRGTVLIEDNIYGRLL
jgi:hypothetical protein